MIFLLINEFCWFCSLTTLDKTRLQSLKNFFKSVYRTFDHNWLSEVTINVKNRNYILRTAYSLLPLTLYLSYVTLAFIL